MHRSTHLASSSVVHKTFSWQPVYTIGCGTLVRKQLFSFHAIVLRNSAMIHLWTTKDTSVHIGSDLLPLSAAFHIVEEPFL